MKSKIKNKKSNSKTLNILFICKYNRFRSRVAEAYFKKLNKNPSIKVKSAGLIQGSYPLSQNQIRAAKNFGINIKGKPQAISTDLLKWTNIMVIVADDVPSNLFNNEKYGRKTIRLNIKDVKTGINMEDNKKVIKLIMIKVNKLNEDLK